MIEDRPFWVTATLAAALVAAAVEQLFWPASVTPVGWPLPFAYTVFLLSGSLLGVVALAHYVETRLDIWRRLGLAFLAGAAVMLGAALLWPGLFGGGDPVDLDFFDEWWLLTLQVGFFLLALMLVGDLVAKWPLGRQAWVVVVGGAAIAAVVGVVSEANQLQAWEEWLRIASSVCAALACVAAAWYFARGYRIRRRRVYRYLVLLLVVSACGATAHVVFTEPDTVGFYLTLAISGLPYVIMAVGLSSEYRSLLRARQDLARADFVNRVSAAALAARSEAQLLASVEGEFARIGYQFRSSHSVSPPPSVAAEEASTPKEDKDGGGARALPPVVVASATGLEDRVLEAAALSAEIGASGLLSETLWRSTSRVVALSLARIEAEESATDLARRMEQANASLRGFAVENAQLLEESSGRMRLLQAMVENTPTMTALVSVGDWSILHANQQLRQRLGDPAQLVGLSVADFFPTVGGRQTDAALGRLVDGREPLFLPEALVESPKAGVFWCDVHATPLYDPEGRPLYVLLCATDVTESIRLRESLESAMGREVRRAEELAAIVRSFPDGLLMFDNEDHLIFMNEGAATILRFAESDGDFVARERSLESRRFQTADGAPLGRHELPDVRALRDEEGVALEVGMALPNGGVVQLLLVASPMRSPLGEVVGAAMTVRDITRMHEIQADLEVAVLAERRRSAQLHVLNQVVMSLNSELDSGRMLDEVLTGAARLTGALGSAYYSSAGDQLRLEAFSDLSGTGTHEASSRARPHIREMVGRALAERRQIRAGSGETDGAGGYLVAPLFAGDGRELGGLALWAPPVSAGFTADDEIFIATLTAHAAVALQNLQRIERERTIAVQLQRAMLPRVPRLVGLECDLVYESASELALVGGDFYDLVPLSRGRTAVIVGDVCGKGLEAATQTARARYMVRAYARVRLRPRPLAGRGQRQPAGRLGRGGFRHRGSRRGRSPESEHALRAGGPSAAVGDHQRRRRRDGRRTRPAARACGPMSAYESYVVPLAPGCAPALLLRRVVRGAGVERTLRLRSPARRGGPSGGSAGARDCRTAGIRGPSVRGWAAERRPGGRRPWAHRAGVRPARVSRRSVTAGILGSVRTTRPGGVVLRAI